MISTCAEGAVLELTVIFVRRTSRDSIVFLQLPGLHMQAAFYLLR